MIVLTYVEIIMFSMGRVSDIASWLTNQAKKQSLTQSTVTVDVHNYYPKLWWSGPGFSKDG